MPTSHTMFVVVVFFVEYPKIFSVILLSSVKCDRKDLFRKNSGCQKKKRIARRMKHPQDEKSTVKNQQPTQFVFLYESIFAYFQSTHFRTKTEKVRFIHVNLTFGLCFKITKMINIQFN